MIVVIEREGDDEDAMILGANGSDLDQIQDVEDLGGVKYNLRFRVTRYQETVFIYALIK